MENCPFLSTYDDKVECFSECPFYNYKENGGLCPFKNINENECGSETIDSADDSSDDEIKCTKYS